MGNFIKTNTQDIKATFTDIVKSGYAFRVLNDFEIMLTNKNTTLFITEEKFDEGVSIDICFGEDLSQKETFNLGWIFRVDKEQNPFPGLDTTAQIKVIADYYFNNMKRINNIDFCKKMRAKYNAEILKTLSAH